ncbi:hypothetical protein [Leptospira wolffii]|uniref:hypothetical protein n=1 Tax=Leptospira wolffii TaxID=409998 RepID=UPI00058EBC8A|nr:hypothetical protein [Leptospira wolffii]
MNTATITDWITAIGTLITALSVVFAVSQVLLLKKQIKDDHERSRREKSVDLLANWAQELDQKSSITRKFAELLNEENLRCIYNQESFVIPDKPEKNKKLYAACLDLDLEHISTDNNQIIIPESHSAQIRWQLIKYLNNLESVISAWAYNIADRELIEDEFSYLFTDQGAGSALKKFRVLTGGAKSYPSIEAFELKMNEKTQIKIREKYKLG